MIVLYLYSQISAFVVHFEDAIVYFISNAAVARF